MPDILDDHIEIYKSLQKIYDESIYETLKGPAQDINNLFLSLLDSKAKDYFLQSKNSVYANKYYQIKDRVKKKDSFYEKLIRKDLGLKIVKQFSIVQDKTVLNTRKPEILNAIKEFDDLIGLRIVTELKIDCANVYELLINSPEFFQDNQIELLDLESQPQKMKNGLGIYRIKGKFQGLYFFELQIKSKIDEAWGDMDHSLFYKDYSVSPIKDTVQVTMNNVGGLLNKIETLLYGLRESGADYEENAEHLKFQQHLDSEIATLLHDKFDVPFNARDSIEFLKFFRKKAIRDDLKLDLIHFEHLNWNSQDPFLMKYIEIRTTNHNLILIESLFLSWKLKNDVGYILSEDTYNNSLNEYLDLYTEFLSEKVDGAPAEIKTNLMDILEYANTSDVFLKPYLLAEIQKICQWLEGLASDDREIKQNIEYLKKAFRIVQYDGTIEDYILSIQLEDIDLSNSLSNIKDAINIEEVSLAKKIKEIVTICLDAVLKTQNQ